MIKAEKASQAEDKAQRINDIPGWRKNKWVFWSNDDSRKADLKRAQGKREKLYKEAKNLVVDYKKKEPVITKVMASSYRQAVGGIDNLVPDAPNKIIKPRTPDGPARS